MSSKFCRIFLVAVLFSRFILVIFLLNIFFSSRGDGWQWPLPVVVIDRDSIVEIGAYVLMRSIMLRLFVFVCRNASFLGYNGPLHCDGVFYPGFYLHRWRKYRKEW